MLERAELPPLAAEYAGEGRVEPCNDDDGVEAVYLVESFSQTPEPGYAAVFINAMLDTEILQGAGRLPGDEAVSRSG